MCRICKSVLAKTSIDEAETKVYLVKISKSKLPSDHFEKIIDRLLGTEELVTDTDLDELWENSRER
jgi:hypothetical protein